MPLIRMVRRAGVGLAIGAAESVRGKRDEGAAPCLHRQASALNAARGEWSHLQRGTATLSSTLARGRPDLISELTYSLTGIKDEIASITWVGSHVAHSFMAGAYTTSLELESKLPDGEEILDLAEEATDYTGVLAWYRDEKTGKESKITAGDQTRPKRLTPLYTSRASAERAVEKEWKKMQAARSGV